MSPSEDGPEEEPEEMDGETQSSETRYWLTNDAAALSLVSMMCLLLLLDVFTSYSASTRLETAFIAGFGVAVTWLFGKGAAKVIFGGGR